MKKTCNGCRAEIKINKILRCEFDYPVRHTKHRGVYMGIIPEKECPKPKTWNEYWHQIELIKKEKNEKNL